MVIKQKDKENQRSAGTNNTNSLELNATALVTKENNLLGMARRGVGVEGGGWGGGGGGEVVVGKRKNNPAIMKVD